MKNIVLTGFMATGKSTVGVLLAKKLGRKFIDTDSLIVEREKRSISEIFEKDGEKYFRAVEKQIIACVSELSDTVIATGGGAVLDKENIKMLRKNSIIVNLCASAKTIYERTIQNTTRPLLNEKSFSDIEQMIDKRKEFYENNDFEIQIDELSPLAIVEKIIATYKTIL